MVEDGLGERGVLALVSPADSIARGDVVDLEALAEILLSAEFLYKQA